MKILYVTTIGGTMVFFKNFICSLINKGFKVDIATNTTSSKVSQEYDMWGCKIHQIDTSRSPFNKSNLTAYKQLKKLVECGDYDIVHCHTPVAAMITRLACRKARKKGTKVIYTAHGFHFYKGAPKLNWLVYYPIEKICSYFTDVLITINKEDYALAQRKMKAKKVEYVPGVGIDVSKFANPDVTKEQKREELGIPQDVKLLISVGELNKNKNHEAVIRAIKDLDVYYIIAGKGDLQDHLQNLIDELNMSNRVRLFGYRTDVAELYAAADIFIFPSFREGLPVSMMEAMASGLPCIASKIRGNMDLIVDGEGGYLCSSTDVDVFAETIKNLVESAELCRKMGKYNLEHIKKFDISVIEKEMEKIYREVFNNGD